METYKIGQYVYNATNPTLSGTIVGYSGETYLVQTTSNKGPDAEKWHPCDHRIDAEQWHPSTFTTDYHLIIRQLLEELGEMKDACFRQKELRN